MTIKRLIILIGIASLIGCTATPSINPNIDQIDATSIGEKISSFDFDIHKIISIETSSESIVGRIRKVVISNNRIFILNRRGGGQIMWFTLEGKFLGKIDRLGQGPGEYIEIRDFTINDSNKEILILDRIDKVHFFDLSGEFARSISIAKEFDHRHIASVNNYIYTEVFSNDGKNLCIQNYQGKFQNIEYPAPRETFALGRPFIHSENNLLMKVKACDTIFRLDQGIAKPFLFMNFGNKQLPRALAMKTTVRKGIDKSREYALNSNFYETKLFYIFNYMSYNFKILGKERFYCFYNKADQSLKCVDFESFGNNLAPKGFRIWTNYQDDYLCTVLYPVILHDYLSSLKDKHNNKLPEKYNLLESLCDRFTIEDNPIIIVYSPDGFKVN